MIYWIVYEIDWSNGFSRSPYDNGHKAYISIAYMVTKGKKLTNAK